jgi:predicted RNA-binding protein YlqC (UPF0109 family)
VIQDGILVESVMQTRLGVEELLLRIVVALVDEPNEAHITSKTTGSGTMFQVTVAPTDVGKLIGKSGRTASSLRILLSAMGVAAKTRYNLDIAPRS